MRIIEKAVQSNLEPTRQNVLWVDTSDPSAPIVKIYLNGKWEVASQPGGEGYVTVKSLTKEEYDALGEKNPETLYLVIDYSLDEPSVSSYLGEMVVSDSIKSVTANVEEPEYSESGPRVEVGQIIDGILPMTFRHIQGPKGEKGDQGNTGSSVDYPYELVNNLTTDDATKGLSAAQGVALDDKISQLGQKVYGTNEVLLDNITTQPSKVYITSDMVQPGDTLVFELTSLNNLQGLLKAEKTGYVHDDYIGCPAGQSVTRTYVVPADFLRIYTTSIANPMVVTCTRVLKGDIDEIDERITKLAGSALTSASIVQDSGSDQTKVMSQKAATNLVDSPFAVAVPDALGGIVAFRMGLLKNDTMPIDKYASFRISSIYMGGAWNVSMQIQASEDGVTWINYDGIDRLATDAPNPLPVIETIVSKVGRFEVVINWPKMGNISTSSLNAILKKDVPNYFLKALQDQINVIVDRENIGVNDYELKDRTKHIIKVDASGNGDYTTIAAAYAAITDSSFDNQYEVVIYPGTYNEYNLIPPKFTHTHGLIPNSVVVTSEGVSSTLPVFDQRVPCKLSNMMIVSGTGYCVHQDQTTLHGIALVNENLHCKKVYGADVSNFAWRQYTNPSVLGIGASLYGAKFVWNNCIFEDGWAASHTKGGDETTPANQHLIYRNCKLVNAMLNIQAVGNSAQQGNYICEVDGLITEYGRPSAVCVPRARNEGDTTYQFPWQIIGGGNKNFVVLTYNAYDTSIDDVWPNINTADIIHVQMANGVSVSKGQFVDVSGNVCNASTPVKDVIGMAVEDGAAGASIRVHIGSFALDNSGVSGTFPNSANDGEYGIGADGRLSSNATNIIGVVKYNNFYRTKTKIPVLSDNLGDSDKTAPTQRLLKFQSNSVFEDYHTSGTGIVGFGVMGDFTQLPSVKKFRFNTYSFNNNVLYGDIQGLIGDEWTNIDSINHTKGDSNIEIVESVYSRFFVVVNYSLLVATGSIYRNLDWQIRNPAVQFVTKDIYGKLKDLIGYVAIPSYELKDSSVVNISVKKDGTGDFATIADAIASIGSATARNEKSSFEKQYCIRVFPGVYNEVNLFVPDYVHIYGLHPDSVVVTSVGLPETSAPVFDMYGNCKLSNMTIISAYGYCVHIDSGRGSRTCVCENLYCKKVYNATSQNPQGDDVRNNAWIGTYTNPSVIGTGMGINEYKFIFKNCTFENGWVAAHTNANNDSTPNTRIEYRNCKLVNAIIDLQTLDNSGGQYHTDGKYICVADNLKTQRGRVSLRLDYFEGNSAWSVLGGCNDNFVPSFNNLDGTSESWENLNTTEKSFIQLASGVSCTKGQFIDCDGNICTGSTPKDDIVGIALDAMSADSLDAVSVWIGNAFPITLTDGEYGIGADGTLSPVATTKIGMVKNNIFYRY